MAIFIAIRDDDTSFFTPAAQLRECYDWLWDVCPISLAVVPFHAHAGSGSAPKNPAPEPGNYDIARNPKLIELLKTGISKQQIHVMLHGYSHEDFAGGHEFEAALDCDRRVAHGKEHLQKLLAQEISVFVPPHNAIGRDGLRAIAKAGLNLSGIPSFRPRTRGACLRSFYTGLRRKCSRLTTGFDRWPLVLPDGHLEIPYFPLTPTANPEDIPRIFESLLSLGSGVLCIATHYWELESINERSGKKLKLMLMDLFTWFLKEKSRVRFLSANNLDTRLLRQ